MLPLNGPSFIWPKSKPPFLVQNCVGRRYDAIAVMDEESPAPYFGRTTQVTRFAHTIEPQKRDAMRSREGESTWRGSPQSRRTES
jgi:hypothetical protein